MRELKKSMLVKQTMFKRSPRNAYIPWEVLFSTPFGVGIKQPLLSLKHGLASTSYYFIGKLFPTFFLLFPTMLSCPVVEASPFPTQ